MNGVTVGGTKYMFLSANDRVVRARKGQSGVHCIKTVQGEETISTKFQRWWESEGRGNGSHALEYRSFVRDPPLWSPSLYLLHGQTPKPFPTLVFCIEKNRFIKLSLTTMPQGVIYLSKGNHSMWSSLVFSWTIVSTSGNLEFWQPVSAGVFLLRWCTIHPQLLFYQLACHGIFYCSILFLCSISISLFVSSASNAGFRCPQYSTLCIRSLQLFLQLSLNSLPTA